MPIYRYKFRPKCCTLRPIARINRANRLRLTALETTVSANRHSRLTVSQTLPPGHPGYALLCPASETVPPPGSQSLQDLQRFHSVKTAFYLCSAIEKRSCRPTDRTAVYEAVNGGSNPVGTTDWGIVQRPVRRTLTPEAQVRVLVPRQDWSFGRRGVCVGLKIRRTWFNSARLRNMVIVALSARVPDCGSGGRGFEPLHSPQGNIAQR